MAQHASAIDSFPALKSLDTFDVLAIPSVNRDLVTQLARCEYIEYIDHRENVIAVGNSGAGKTHIALGLGLAACQRGMPVGFTAAALVHELMEARDERRLLNLQRQLSRLNLLIVDELGFVPLSPTGHSMRGLESLQSEIPLLLYAMGTSPPKPQGRDQVGGHEAFSPPVLHQGGGAARGAKAVHQAHRRVNH